jgi:hypothetical protein
MRSCALILSFSLLFSGLSAFGGVSVSSPANGATVSNPAHFVATATTSCAKGVASMGIYPAPYSLAYVGAGAKLDTNLTLNPGSYKAIVQEWDNCGGSATTPVTINVVGSNVSVSSPAPGAVSTSVHYVANASTSCAQGVSAMGVYTAANKLAYKVNGASLDTTLTFTPGTYDTVVEEWDGCGGASTKAIALTVGSGGNGVQVSAPANDATVSSPVHFAASASTTCTKGVSAVGVYTSAGLLAFTSNGSSLDTNLTLSPGAYDTVIQSWDGCGGYAKTPVHITVNSTQSSSIPGTAKTFYALQKSKGWTGFGELSPNWDTCTNCSPQVIWSMTQGTTSPSESGSAMSTYIAGTQKYSDALWNNHLIGDFSSQGLPDGNQALSSTLHNFVYAVDFYGANVELSQALEFDLNQFVGGKSFIWGHECRVAGGHTWDIWNNAANKWVSTGVACNPISNGWNHLAIAVQRTSDNRLLYQSITLNGKKSTLNMYDNPTGTNWNGVTINYQLDGNINQAAYTIVLDNLNFTYY